MVTSIYACRRNGNRPKPKVLQHFTHNYTNAILLHLFRDSLLVGYNSMQRVLNIHTLNRVVPIKVHQELI